MWESEGNVDGGKCTENGWTIHGKLDGWNTLEKGGERGCKINGTCVMKTVWKLAGKLSWKVLGSCIRGTDNSWTIDGEIDGRLWNIAGT